MGIPIILLVQYYNISKISELPVRTKAKDPREETGKAIGNSIPVKTDSQLEKSVVLAAPFSSIIVSAGVFLEIPGGVEVGKCEFRVDSSCRWWESGEHRVFSGLKT